MEIYKKLYYKVFNDITDVIKLAEDIRNKAIQNGEDTVKLNMITYLAEKLKDVQVNAEEMYISSDDVEDK